MPVPYDKIAAGERLREKRILLGYTQDEIAEKINRAPKYYADIERGSCGMSVETLLLLSDVLNLSLDTLLLGKTTYGTLDQYSKEAQALLEIVSELSETKQKGLLRMFHIFMETWKHDDEV